MASNTDAISQLLGKPPSDSQRTEDFDLPANYESRRHQDTRLRAAEDAANADSGGGGDDMSNGSGGSTSRSVTSPTNSARTVAGLMGISVLFALIGNEINTGTNGGKPKKLANGMDKGATIIIGGFIAAGLLTALTGAGEAGRKFAVGLAGVTAATTVLVYGKPVWDVISVMVGGKATGGTGGTKATGATTATAPTHGTATGVALAQAA